MWRILKNKFLGLGRDEDGAALVVTLAIFFLMYLGCMGVYAVSMSVKERVQLQNAVDAAAYSAAVVQADTLSRIATINRAMSWTYVQMTREQMDYIVLRWLKHTVSHYTQDMRGADSYNKGGVLGSPCGHHGSCGSGWYIGPTPWGTKEMLRVRLNGLFVTSLMTELGFDIGPLKSVSSLVGIGSTPLISELQTALTAYDALELFKGVTGGSSSINNGLASINDASKEILSTRNALEEPPSNIETANSILEMCDGLNGTPGKYEGAGSVTEVYLQTQIAMDRINIALMNIAERRLARDMPKKISAAVNNVLKANLFAGMSADCYYYISQNENPLEGELTGIGNGYFGNLLNNEIGERRFLAFSGHSGNLVKTFLGNSKKLEDFLFSRIVGGLDQWFVRGNGHERTDGKRGLQRCYKHWADPDEPFRKIHMSHNPLPVSCWNTGRGKGTCSICRGDPYLHASPPSIALYSEWAWWSDVWSCPRILWKRIHLHPMAHRSKVWPWKLECDHNRKPGLFGLDDLKKFGTAVSALPGSVDDVERLVKGLLDGRTDAEGNPIPIDKSVYGSAENEAALDEAISKIEQQLAGGDGWQTTKPEGDMNSFASADAGVRNYEDGCLITYPALNLTEHFVGFARLYADSPQIYNSCYVGERAKPLILNTSYFGSAGTITVGVRWKNQNAFARFMRSIGGIFSAFNPDWNGDGAETHTYVFASAKAGYRDKGSIQSQGDYSGRAYRIDWNPENQDWNLCQSDWDAVFVPVRRAGSYALMGEWIGTDEGLLENWVSSVSDWHRLNGQVLDDYDSWDHVNAPGGVLIGNEHTGTLDWRKLGRVMFH